jgi:hypothetical protein
MKTVATDREISLKQLDAEVGASEIAMLDSLAVTPLPLAKRRFLAAENSGRAGRYLHGSV